MGSHAGGVSKCISNRFLRENQMGMTNNSQKKEKNAEQSLKDKSENQMQNMSEQN